MISQESIQVAETMIIPVYIPQTPRTRFLLSFWHCLGSCLHSSRTLEGSSEGLVASFRSIEAVVPGPAPPPLSSPLDVTRLGQNFEIAIDGLV